MDKWMFNVHESISSPCHFQGDTLLDDDGCLHSIYEKIMSVLSSSGSDGKLSTVYHYHFAAIQYGAIIVAGNFLLAEEAETLSLLAMDRANIAMKGLMKWFDKAEEGSNETVVTIVGELNQLAETATPFLKRQVDQHPLNTTLTNFKTLMDNHTRTAFLRGNGRRSALLDEESFQFPKLTNGENKICFMNAGFGIFRKLFPDIRERMKPDKPLSRELELVLNSKGETSLTGVKKVLHAYHPEERDYEEESKGGVAAETLKHLVDDFSRESGEEHQFGHILSEELGFIKDCAVCGTRCGDLDTIVLTRKNTCIQVSGGVRKEVSLQEELEGAGWVTCPKCSNQKERNSAPNRLLLEFVEGVAWRLKGIEESVNVAGKTFKATAILHSKEDHFWMSAKSNGSWWRIDDFCGSEELWRRPYTGQGDTQTTIVGHHRLNASVHLLLLEEVSDGLEQCRYNC